MDINEMMQVVLEKLETRTNKIQSSQELQEPLKPKINPLNNSQIVGLMRGYGIPSKFINLEFVANQSLIGIEKGICLTGNPGTGKTMALCLMVRDWLLRKSNCFWKFDESWKFISFPEFIMQVQDSFRNNSEITAYDMLKKVAYAKRLVIDDLGAEKPTDYVRQATYYIINHREMNELPTFITSNFSMDYLDENLDPRISSRIAGMCEIVCLEGKDRRIKGKDRRVN